jgi:hypothetical protein
MRRGTDGQALTRPARAIPFPACGKGVRLEFVPSPAAAGEGAEPDKAGRTIAASRLYKMFPQCLLRFLLQASQA